MQKPVEPNLLDYQITARDLEQGPSIKPLCVDIRKRHWPLYVLLLVCYVFSFSFVYEGLESIFFAAFIAVFISLFVIPLAMIPAAAMIVALEILGEIYFYKKYKGTDELRVYEAINAYNKAIEQHEAEKRKFQEWQHRTKVDWWFKLSGHQFEAELGKIFKKLGYTVFQTSGSGDGGADLILKKDKETTIVECKAHKKPIGPAVVRALYGVMKDFGADKAIIASLSGISKGSDDFIKDKPIELMDVHDIVAIQKSFDEPFV